MAFTSLSDVAPHPVLTALKVSLQTHVDELCAQPNLLLDHLGNPQIPENDLRSINANLRVAERALALALKLARVARKT